MIYDRAHHEKPRVTVAFSLFPIIPGTRRGRPHSLALAARSPDPPVPAPWVVWADLRAVLRLKERPIIAQAGQGSAFGGPCRAPGDMGVASFALAVLPSCVSGVKAAQSRPRRAGGTCQAVSHRPRCRDVSSGGGPERKLEPTCEFAKRNEKHGLPNRKISLAPEAPFFPLPPVPGKPGWPRPPVEARVSSQRHSYSSSAPGHLGRVDDSRDAPSPITCMGASCMYAVELAIRASTRPRRGIGTARLEEAMYRAGQQTRRTPVCPGKV